MTVNHFFKFSMLSAFIICIASNAECMRRNGSFFEKKDSSTVLKKKTQDLCLKVLGNQDFGSEKKGAYINEYEELVESFEKKKNQLNKQDQDCILSRFRTIKETLKIPE